MATMRASEDVMKFGGVINLEKCGCFIKVSCLYVSQELGGRAEFMFLLGFHSNK